MCKLGIMKDKGATLAQQMAGTVDPRYNKGPRDWQNLFAITRFCFVYFYYYWGNENRSLYGGLCYIEVRYIEVPL